MGLHLQEKSLTQFIFPNSLKTMERPGWGVKRLIGHPPWILYPSLHPFFIVSFLYPMHQLFKGWRALSIGRITIRYITQLIFNHLSAGQHYLNFEQVTTYNSFSFAHFVHNLLDLLIISKVLSEPKSAKRIGMQDFKDLYLTLHAQSGFTLALEMSTTRDVKRLISSRQDGRQILGSTRRLRAPAKQFPLTVD